MRKGDTGEGKEEEGNGTARPYSKCIFAHRRDDHNLPGNRLITVDRILFPASTLLELSREYYQPALALTVIVSVGMAIPCSPTSPNPTITIASHGHLF